MTPDRDAGNDRSRLRVNTGCPSVRGWMINTPLTVLANDSQFGRMLDGMFHRLFQGNLRVMYNRMFNWMINGMGSFTKASMGSFKGTLI